MKNGEPDRINVDHQWIPSRTPEYQRAYRAKNAVKAHEYRQRMKKGGRDKFLDRVGHCNAQAKGRGVNTRKWRIAKKELLQLWLRQNEMEDCPVRCAVCGESVVRWEIDHVQPLSQGGQHEISNIQLLCHNCHIDKSRTELCLRLPDYLLHDPWEMI